MENWYELKNWVLKEGFQTVLRKMDELEEQDYFTAYTNLDGYELIKTNSDEGVIVWTYEHPDNKYKLKVKKAAIIYYDEIDECYDCKTNGVHLIEEINT
ncbi:hypothetical protein M3231_03575 [Neobacillus mesonae]|nr:hypothetical protein [Neobacillus mesonae]